jgi:hypothetical protein
MRRRLPLGVQDFVSIREDGLLYVDKTARIHELATASGKTFFLSRPRRFGKSLLCSTLGALFEGRRELFAGLVIDARPDELPWEWKPRPVIRIDLNVGDYPRGGGELDTTLVRCLEVCADKYGVPFAGVSASDKFARLMGALHAKCGERVVVVVDEYDKPLLNTLDCPEAHGEMRKALKAFYGVLKACDEHLRMAFLTGVTKFAQASVFSASNTTASTNTTPRAWRRCRCCTRRAI